MTTLFCESPEIVCSAVISPDGFYRYSLTRVWDNLRPLVVFNLLNPSTADAERNDPTVRKTIGFA